MSEHTREWIKGTAAGWLSSILMLVICAMVAEMRSEIRTMGGRMSSGETRLSIVETESVFRERERERERASQQVFNEKLIAELKELSKQIGELSRTRR